MRFKNSNQRKAVMAKMRGYAPDPEKARSSISEWLANRKKAKMFALQAERKAGEIRLKKEAAKLSAELERTRKEKAEKDEYERLKREVRQAKEEKFRASRSGRFLTAIGNAEMKVIRSKKVRNFFR